MAKNKNMGLGNLVSTDYGYSTQPQVSMIGVNPSVTEKLSQIQATRSSPLSVSSGYRSPSYNRAVGGARKSQHVLGNAIDISTAGMSQAEVKALAQEASRVGFRGIGIYSNSLHFDVREHAAVWGPNYKSTSIPAGFQDFATAHIKNEYQGTAPAPLVAAVERQSLPAVGPVPEARPETSLASYTPQNVPTPTARDAFTPGGIINAPKVSLSPVSSAQAAPAQASPAPSMAQSPVSAARTAPSIAPNPSRFGPATAPNINEANALRSALQSQAAQINAPAPQNVSAISSLRSLSPTAPQTTQAPQQAPTQQKPSSFTETPSSYQTAAFSTAAPKMDAFGQPPAPGLQPAAPSQYTKAPAPQQAPALAPATRTISTPQVASVPDEATIDAPAPDPALNSFPDKPSPGIFGGLFGKPSAVGLLGQIAGVGLGTAAAGPLGGIVGGLLGKSLANNYGGGLLSGGYSGPKTNVGSGLGAISSVLGGGMPVGSTAFSRSNPGMSVTSLPGGATMRTSEKFGWTEITSPDGRTGRAKSNKGRTGGAGGNYGGVKSEGARNAVDSGKGGLF